MNKDIKKNIVICLIFIIVLIIVNQFRINEAQKIQYGLFSLKEGQYIVEDDFYYGIYDLTIQNDDVNIDGVNLKKGTALKAMPFKPNQKITIQGKGEVVFNLYDDYPISLYHDRYQLDVHGNYIVGEHLEAGNYTLKFIGDKNKEIYVTILEDSKFEAISEKMFYGNEYPIELKNHDVLSVNLDFNQSNQDSIQLIKEEKNE